MAVFKILMYGRKPIGVILAVQEQEIKLAFPPFTVFQEEYNITPSSISKKNCVIMIEKDRNKFYNIKIIEEDDYIAGIPVNFIVIGDGKMLLETANVVDDKQMDKMRSRGRSRGRGIGGPFSPSEFLDDEDDDLIDLDDDDIDDDLINLDID